MTGVSRFDCYPSDFLNGVIGLIGDEIAAYTVVLMLQYDRGEPVAYVGREREISVRTGLPRGRLAKAVDRLIELGKLSIKAGCLFNERTSKELEKIAKRFEENAKNSHEGGKATSEKWEAIRNENNDYPRPTGKPTGKPKIGPLPSSLPPPPLEAKQEKNLTVLCPKPVRTKGEYPHDFLEFWAAYPTDSNMSKKEALAEWTKLSAEDRQGAIRSCPAFSAYCRAHPDYRPIHANRYLSKGRFEGHLATATAVSAKVFIRIGTRDWDAWDVWYRRTKGTSPPVNKEGTGWHFPSSIPGHVAEAPPGAVAMTFSKLITDIRAIGAGSSPAMATEDAS